MELNNFNRGSLMKKGVSIFESIFCLILYGLICAVLLLKFVSLKAFIICLVFMGIGIETIYLYIITFSWRGLPKGSMYNPTGFIEIHVENMCGGSRKIFMKLCLNILLYGVTERKNIMVDTWLIRENHIKDLFGCAAKIYSPSIIQSLINFIFKSQFKSKSKNKSFRCIIYTDKLTEEQRAHIINQLNKLLINL